MHDKSKHDSAFDTIARLWSRRKWLAIAVFLVVATGMASFTLSLPNIYRATASVLVNTKNPIGNVPGFTDVNQPNSLDTVTEQVLSRARMQDLITRFDLYPEIRERVSSEAAIKRMRTDIKLERKNGVQEYGRNPTFAFTLSYKGWNPQVVAAVTNALVSSYVNESNHIRSQQVTSTAKSLRAQLDLVKRKLDGQEKQLNAFVTRNIGKLPDQQQMILATLSQLNLQLSQNRQDQQEALRRRDEILRKMADSGDASLAQLEQELASLRTRYTENYPDVMRVKAQIEARKKNYLGSGSVQSKSPLQEEYEALNADIHSGKLEAARIEAKIASYRKRVSDAPLYAQPLQALNQNYAETRDIYASLLKRYQQALLVESSAGPETEQYSILDAAVIPSVPVGPRRLQLLLMSVMLSLGMAGAAVFMAEELDTSFHSTRDLRAFTRVPVLVGIPQIVTRGDELKRQGWFGLSAAGLLLILIAVLFIGHFFGHANQQMVWMLTKYA